MAISIYQIESPTGRFYIGQTRDLCQRKSHYKGLHCKSQCALYKSLVKYGFDSHQLSIIKEYPNNTLKVVIDNAERFYIKVYREKGFDLLNIADGGHGGLISEATRAKLAKAQTGKKYSKESRKKMSLAHIGLPGAMKGVKLSTKTKNKISKNRKGKCMGKNHWRAKNYKNLKTEVIYYTVTEAAKAVGIKRTTLSMMLCGHNRNSSGVVLL